MDKNILYKPTFEDLGVKERNQKLFLEILRWIVGVRTQTLFSVYGLLFKLKNGYTLKNSVVFYHYTPQYLPLLQLLQKTGAIQSFCLLPVSWFTPQTPILGGGDSIVLIYIAAGMLEPKRTAAFVTVYSAANNLCQLAYSEVKHLVNDSKNVFLFHDSLSGGVVTQHTLVQHKRGGILLCKLAF